MTEKDAIILCSSIVGLLAGVLAELTVLAARRRLDLWLRYAGYWSPGWMLTFAMSHWICYAHLNTVRSFEPG